MSKVFFTSDPHFGHSNIIQYCNRPFANADEMDKALIDNWNSVVGKDDHVYVLGDVSMGNKVANYLRRLNGYKHLIVGNHDQNPKLEDGWTSIHDLHEIKVEGQPIVLCHYPMVSWNRSHYGAWQLFGHHHGNLADDPTKLSIDVGVDCHNFHPITFQQVKEIMQRKKPKIIQNKYA